MTLTSRWAPSWRCWRRGLCFAPTPTTSPRWPRSSPVPAPTWPGTSTCPLLVSPATSQHSQAPSRPGTTSPTSSSGAGRKWISKVGCQALVVPCLHVQVPSMCPPSPVPPQHGTAPCACTPELAFLVQGPPGFAAALQGAGTWLECLLGCKYAQEEWKRKGWLAQCVPARDSMIPALRTAGGVLALSKASVTLCCHQGCPGRGMAQSKMSSGSDTEFCGFGMPRNSCRCPKGMALPPL